VSLDQLDLTDEQLNAVARAAGALQLQERDRFLRAIAHRLSRVMVGDGSVARAIRDELVANRYLTATAAVVGGAVTGRKYSKLSSGPSVA
jgi:hypothetical protein